MNVTLIGKTDTGILSYTEFLACIARRCYSIKSFNHIKDTVLPNSAEPKNKQVDAKKLLKKIIDAGHMSILEHISLTFSIEDVPVYLVSQLTRHRMASFAVTSFRYNNLTKKGTEDITYVPSELTDKQKEIFGEAILSSFSKYSKLVEDGVKPEVARGILPQGAFTNLIMTMNIRELFHFIDLRNCLRADKPIRELAGKILKICDEIDSYLFSFAKHSCRDCSKFTTCDVVRQTPICKYNIVEEKK